MKNFVRIFILCCLTSSAFAKSTFTIGVVEAPPHVIANLPAGRPDGLVSKFIDEFLAPELKKKHGVEIVWDQAPISRLLKSTEKGQDDMMLFLLKSPEREKEFIYGDEGFMEGVAGMIVYGPSPKDAKSDNIENYRHKVIGLLAGSLELPLFKKYEFTIVPITGYDVPDRSLSLIANKRVDGIFIHVYDSAEYMVQGSHYKDQMHVLKVSELKFDFYFVFSKTSSPEIRRTVNEVFKKHRHEYAKWRKAYLQ
jgi:hypothetical protein